MTASTQSPDTPSPAWFRTAVFYEVPVYAFGDTNGDGIGDFRGLTEKLDYLQWLGVDCLWILPFYESPLRDGGYDVSDFESVLARYGTVDDVRAFLDAAHDRGLRVIADMIVNHTSDQHPWFQKARQPGSPTRDWYVWSDTDDKWPEARVIFTDTHDSNWTWDETAGAYYWHRFFWHQPDLNFDNPEVREAMQGAVRFWLDAGFDGLRLDAVPYLYERDGTNGENLPETHAYLKELRAMVDAEFDDKILLAEANQWPEDVVAYFGDGDECHMAFHFPVMPRLFMALAQGHATSIVDILARTPDIPEGCQWGVFLRNHDELTLEMVTEEEQAFMYGHYAPDPSMKKNVGIRRRLAPLLNGDKRKIKLLVGLLLSLPGSPILYYGDEIGMGDIHTLEDRDGVRTPMQWDASPRAGFSAADPADFYLPLVDTPGYETSSINVEQQQADPDSLLNWTRQLLAIRRNREVFGTGAFVPHRNANAAVFAFTRRSVSEQVLVLANLSDEVQTVADDPAFEGYGASPDLNGSLDGRPVDRPLEPYEFRWLVTDAAG
jgi:maltose alpha-D-glucosyltransferase/alpha-amylase